MKRYQRQWRELADREMLEQRQATYALRWQQLSAILRLAAALNLPASDDDHESEAVRRRWNQLRQRVADESQ